MDFFDDFPSSPGIYDQPLSVFENNTRSMEKRATKLRKSCELCRNSKARCISSKESGHCQRCAKEGKECIFLEAKPRPKRAKSSRIRVAEIEEKLDSLVAILAETQQTTKPTISLSDESSSMDSLLYKTHQNTEQRDQLFDQSQSRGIEPIEYPHPLPQSAGPHSSNYQYSVPQFQDYVFHELHDPISKNIISFEQAEESIEFFRSKAPSFPWVTLPENTSLDTIRRERPFLLLSVLAFGAQKELGLQSLLEGELRESLMKKLINLGEKSLDLLQGLLLYIASVCQNLRKPSNIRFTDYANDCCQMLALMSATKTDQTIPYFVRLQRFSDDVNHAFDYDDLTGQAELDSIRIEVLTKAFNDQLKQFESSFPPEIWDNATLKLVFLSQRIYVNEIGFHATRPHFDMIGVTFSDQRSWYNSASRNESLIRSMHAAKDYFDYFLSITGDQLKDFTFTDFIRMLYAILIMGAFKGRIDAPTLDIDSVRQIADADVYLRALMAKFTDNMPKKEPNHNPYLFQFSGLLESYKTRFQDAANSLNIEKAPGDYTPHRFGFEDMLPAILRRCIEWDNIMSAKAQQQAPPLVDEWEQVLSSWPSSFDPSVMSMDSSLLI